MSKKYIDKLSIIIPTYNRKNQLTRLLNSIQKEDHDLLYEIVIIDNNSDYNIYDTLNKFKSLKLRIIKNPVNTGMASNLTFPFMHCKTKWVWFISDDDIVIKGCINNIIDDIRNNSKNVLLFKYSVLGNGKFGEETDKDVTNLEEFIDYYYEESTIRSGNLVFFSNNVYNMNYAHNYLGYAFEYSYTQISHLMPAIFGISEKHKVKFRSKKIIHYIHPGEDFWSFKKVGLGLSTISHLPLQLTKKYKRRFLRVFMTINYFALFLDLLNRNDSNNYRIYSIIYSNVYIFYLKYPQKIVYFLLLTLLKFPKYPLMLLHFLIRTKKHVQKFYRKK